MNLVVFEVLQFIQICLVTIRKHVDLALRHEADFTTKSYLCKSMLPLLLYLRLRRLHSFLFDFVLGITLLDLVFSFSFFVCLFLLWLFELFKVFWALLLIEDFVFLDYILIKVHVSTVKNGGSGLKVRHFHLFFIIVLLFHYIVSIFIGKWDWSRVGCHYLFD